RSTASVGLALAAAGTDDTTLNRILAYLTTHIDEAAYAAGTGNPPDATIAARIALLVEATGGDAHNVGGRDLLAGLASHICTATGSDGFCSAAGDIYGAFSPSTQALAILALKRGGVTPPASTITRLLQMQCIEGGFNGSLIAAGEPCDGENATTAFAL